MPHAIANTTTVLTAVARLELTPSIPTFAKIEVSAAKTADRNAKTAHIMLPPYVFSLHRNFNLIIFNCDNTTFIVSVSGCPRPAYNFVSGVFKPFG